MTEKLSQTIEFTERLMKFSSPTEVMVFKQLLQSRLHVFLNYNADANNILQTPFEVEFQPGNNNTSRQQIMVLLGNEILRKFSHLCNYYFEFFLEINF